MTAKVYDVHLELTNHCNLACSVCPNRIMQRPKTFMPFSMVKHIINVNPSIQEVGLSVWGEPLLHPDFLSIVRFLCKRGLKVGFSTNATLLTKKLSVDLIEAGLHDINFSLNTFPSGATEETKQVCSDQIENIQYFLHLSGHVKASLTLTVTPMNEATIKKLAGMWKPYVKVNVQPQVLFTHDDRKGKCYELYRNHLVVLSNGAVVPCCVDYEGSCVLGNAWKDKLTEIYNGEAMRKIRKEGHVICDFCSEFQTCYAKPRFKRFSLVQRLHVLAENISK